MQVELRPSPVLPPSYSMALTGRKSVHRILREAGAPDWFMDYGVIRLNGVVVPREQWRHVKVKPEADGLLELCVVPQKGNLLPILASVALVAVTAGIGAGALGPAGIGLFGASFAAGGIGASATAAAVGIAGQLAISMLTKPPQEAAQAEQRELSQAGISANGVNKFNPLSVVYGNNLYSPPHISEPYTTYDNDELTVHTIYGTQGRRAIDNIQINGSAIALLEGLNYETREGGPADSALTLCQLTCIQQDSDVVISKFTLEHSGLFVRLADQATPDESAPAYHYFRTDGEVDEIWLRYLAPGGFIQAQSGVDTAVPVRIEIRKVGDSTWRKLPTVHINDLKLGSPMRFEVKLKFQTQPSGRHFSNAKTFFNTYELSNIAGIGQTFEYQADAYFQNSSWVFTSQLPVMTAATTSGVTMSASSELGASQAAWKAADAFFTTTNTSWQPANNSLPAWLKVDFGLAKTIRSYRLNSGEAFDTVPTTAPLTWYVEGSNDDTNWTRLDVENVDISALPLMSGIYQVGTPGSYRYYRWNFLSNNGAANNQINVSHMVPFLFDAIGIDMQLGAASHNGFACLHSVGSTPRCAYGSLTKDGATFYLDPAQFLPGAYEVRTKRGRAYERANFNEKTYDFGSPADFFEYNLVGTYYEVTTAQRDFRTDMLLEVFSSVSYDKPVDTSGVACIAVEMKNTVINSVAAEFSSYAPVYSSGVWTDVEAVTANPAALYRWLEIGHANPVPTPGEIIDENAFVAWYERCEALGYEANFIAQSKSLAEVKKVLAYCGFADPRDTNLVSIAEDYDRSGDAISQMLSPLNSRNLGTDLTLPRLPHAIYAEYFDAADDYKVRRDIIYRDGFDVNTATYFDTLTYEGFTNTTKVAARAAFDLLQMQARSRAYTREIGIEGYSLKRGDLVGLNDDTLDKQQARGVIRSIQTSGGNITGITVDNIIAFSAGQGDIENVNDISTLTDILNTDTPFGVAIRIADGTSTARPLSNVTDSNVCTFTTPFTESGSGIEVGQLAVFGISGREFRRAIVIDVTPNDLETRTIILRDEAPELFA